MAETSPARAVGCPRADRTRIGPALRALAVVVLVALATMVPGAGAGAEGPRPDPSRQIDDGPQLPVDPDADPARTRRTAEDILAGDEFRPPPDEAPGGRSVLDRIRDWFRDLIPDLRGPGSATFDGLSVVVVGIMAVGALALVVWVISSSRRSRRAPTDPDELDADIEITPLRSPTEWSAEAERCEAAGEHRAAVRARFRAVTTTMVRRDLVVDTPGRTAGELRIDLDERAPEASSAFVPLADHFERVWFGQATAGPEDSARAKDLATAALHAAPDHPIPATVA